MNIATVHKKNYRKSRLNFLSYYMILLYENIRII